MRSYSEQRVMLARMVKACAETRNHLSIIERLIRKRAERITITARVKTRQYDRMKSTWTHADERQYQENAAQLRFERRCEVDALARKLERQEGAILAFRVRYRINEDTDLGDETGEAAS